MSCIRSISLLKLSTTLLTTLFALSLPVVAAANASNSLAAKEVLHPPTPNNALIPVPTLPAQQSMLTPAVPNLAASGYILIDSMTGKVLADKDADKRLPPASLTKLMSMYLVSAALKNGTIKPDDKVRISTKAWKMEGSRMFIKVGDEIAVKDLLRGVIVASGNDATVALAEHIAGTEEVFTTMMNQQAKLLGMTNTHFTDSTGLPHPDHYSSARDLARLTQAYIRTFPEDYSLYTEKWVEYHGIRQPNRNRLLWRYQYADGLKTGHTNEAGYCLVSSAKKDGMRLIGVVLGAPSDLARTEDSIRLLTFGFRFYETRKLYAGSSPLTQARIWKGEKAELPLGIQADLYATIPAGQYKNLHSALEVNTPLNAPVIKGQACGKLVVKLNQQVILAVPLIALENNQKGNIWRRASDTLKHALSRHYSKKEDKLNTA